jgi:hypothetical protein
VPELPPPSVAEWALANPAARDALLALAERAVALQPAAEAAVQLCRATRPAGGGPPERSGGPEDARLVRDAYRSLAEHLDTLGLRAPVAAQLGELLERHLEALEQAMADGTVEGLGPPAGRLVGLRDLLRRTAAFGGRAVSDIPGI